MYKKVLSQKLYLPKSYIYLNYIYREHKCMNMYWMRTSCLKSYTCESVLSENQPRHKVRSQYEYQALYFQHRETSRVSLLQFILSELIISKFLFVYIFECWTKDTTQLYAKSFRLLMRKYKAMDDSSGFSMTSLHCFVVPFF